MTAGLLPNSYLDLVVSGLDANLPTAANVLVPAGHTAFYYATDTQILYQWDSVAIAWRGARVAGAPIAVGAAITAKATVDGLTYLLNTASGSVLTLPAAKGTGLTLTAAVTTTCSSNAHKVLTSPITDLLIGQAVGATAAGATLKFSAGAAGGFHSIQMPFAGTQPSGGFDGDFFSFTDIASGKWLVEAMYQSGTTATTPFSTATS